MNKQFQVTGVIALVALLAFISSCGKETPKSNPDLSRLPQKIDIPKPGVVQNIVSRDLLDRIKSGEVKTIYFLQEASPEKPEHVVQLPGMKTVYLGDMFNITPTLSRNEPIYLICLFGDDSKRMAEQLAKDGFDTYYLDGGSYRMYQDIQKNRWSIPVTTGS